MRISSSSRSTSAALGRTLETDFAEPERTVQFAVVLTARPFPAVAGWTLGRQLEVSIAVEAAQCAVERHKMGAERESNREIARASIDAKPQLLDIAGQSPIRRHHRECLRALRIIQAQNAAVEARFAGRSLRAKYPALLGQKPMRHVVHPNGGIRMAHELEIVEVQVAKRGIARLDQQGQQDGAAAHLTIVGAAPVDRPLLEGNDHPGPAVRGTFDRPLESLAGAIGVTQREFMSARPADPECQGIGGLGDSFRRLAGPNENPHVSSAVREIEVQPPAVSTAMGGSRSAFEAAGGAGEFAAGGELDPGDLGFKVLECQRGFRPSDPGKAEAQRQAGSDEMRCGHAPSMRPDRGPSTGLRVGERD